MYIVPQIHFVSFFFFFIKNFFLKNQFNFFGKKYLCKNVIHTIHHFQTRYNSYFQHARSQIISKTSSVTILIYWTKIWTINATQTEARLEPKIALWISNKYNNIVIFFHFLVYCEILTPLLLVFKIFGQIFWHL